MTASERLKEIEEQYNKENYSVDDAITPENLEWLISRVHTLEKRNERLREGLKWIENNSLYKLITIAARKILAEDEGVKDG